MAQASTVVPPNSTGNPINCSVTVGAVYRQNICIGDPDTDANVVTIGSDKKLPVKNENALDYDTGAGTVSQGLVGIALPASGGPVAGGTVSNPIVISDVDYGTSDYHAVSAGSTNAANIKASAGKLYSIHIFNNASYPVYVKFHNTAGTPTAGAGVVLTIGIQAGLERDILLKGITFGTGIGISIVKGIADNDATAVLLNDCVVDVEYK